MSDHSRSLLVRDLISEKICNLEFEGKKIISKKVLSATTAEPGFVLCPLLGDPQINGGFGYSFGQPGFEPKPWKSLAEHLLRRGIGWFLPTLITDSIEHLKRAFLQLESMRQADPFLQAMCPGYHLEGPWISPEDGYRGAHPRSWVMNPQWSDFESLQNCSGGNIRLVTIAPELPGAIAMVRRLVDSGVRVALGHTNADSEQIRQAVEAGATLSTHLGNGIGRTIPRHDNPLWAQLAQSKLIPSLIPDGHHLPLEFVQTVLAAKGLSKVIVTADSSPIAGYKAGTYSLWNTEVEISPEGKVSIPGSGLLAGSGCFTDDCLRWMIEKVGLDLKTALPLCGQQAANALGLKSIGMDIECSFALVKLTDQRIWDVGAVVFDGREAWGNWEV